MNQRASESLIDKINGLPPERRAEVENFVEFLAAKEKRRDDDARFAKAREVLAARPLAPMTPEEIQAEIDAYRAEQRRAAGA
jgi:hypothetical protein